jgi:hypothetical protein
VETKSSKFSLAHAMHAFLKKLSAPTTAIAIVLSLFPTSELRADVPEKRFALVIGNWDYAASIGGKLNNPEIDIKLVADALRVDGFDVTEVKNADRASMWTALDDYIWKLAEQSGQVVSFLYYSGHGISQPNTSQNFLIPVDVKDFSKPAVWRNAVSLDDLTSDLTRKAPNAAHFIVFDACRSVLRIPFKTENKGFSRPPEKPGIFVAFATSPDTTASDRGTDGGPYATVLASELRSPGIDHLAMFQNVKQRVFDKTQGEQVPWDNNGLLRRVYFNSPPQSESARAAAKPSNGAVVPTTPTKSLTQDIFLNLLRASYDDPLEFSSNVSIEVLRRPLDLGILSDFIREGYPRELLFWLFTDHFEVETNRHTLGYRYAPPDDYGCQLRDNARRCFIDWVRVATLGGLTVEQKTLQKSAAEGRIAGATAFARLCFNTVLAEQARDAMPEDLVRSTFAKLGSATAVSPQQRCGSPAWDPLSTLNKPQYDVFIFQIGDATFKIVPRSAYGVFEFLGKLIKMQRRAEALERTTPKVDSALVPPERGDVIELPPTLKSVHDDEVLIRVLRDGGRDCFVETSYRGQHYCVPDDASTTKRIFNFMIQLLQEARR